MSDSRPETYKHIGFVRELLTLIACQLLSRANSHDESKLESPELEVFDEMTSKLAACTYGSDEYKEFLKQMKPALDHHYQNNRHHPECHSKGVQDMNLVDLVEMLCDWKAATRRHDNGNVHTSIDINQKRFGYSDELKQILLNTVELFYVGVPYPPLEVSEVKS
jgi:hypothetical protein